MPGYEVHIFSLLNSEIERIGRRKQGFYTKGRIDGYKKCLEFINFSKFPSEYDLLEIRTRLSEYCNSKQITEDTSDYPSDYLNGFRKSFRNVYHTVGFMVQEPMANYNEITQGQWKLLSMLSDKCGEEFSGLTKEEANIWIKEHDNGN